MRASHRNVLLTVLVVVAAVAATGVAAGQSSGTVIGRPNIDVYTSTTEVEPGTQTDLDLVLSNDGRLSRGGPAQHEERVTTARGVAVDVENGGTPFEINTGRVAVGEVPRGTTTTDSISITVPENVNPGRYRIPVTVSYAYTVSVEYSSVGSPEYNDLSKEETQYITLRVRDRAQFEVVDTEATTQVGDTGTVAVELRNHGTRTASDASVVLSASTDELTFGSGSTSSTGYVGAWEPGTTETVEYTVAVDDDAALRNYSLSAAVEYEDTDGIARTSNPLAVGMRPAREQSFALRDTNAVLRVGEDGRFAGTVVNRGPDTARQPVVVLTSSTGVDILADAGWAPGDAVLCCIGPSTAAAAAAVGWTVDRVPAQHDSAGMVRELRDDVDGKTVALARSDRASATMPDGLGEAGAEVSETTLYRLLRPEEAGESAELAAAGELDGAAFTSSSTVTGFLDAAEERGIRAEAVAGLRDAVVGAIAESPAATAREAGIAVDVVPEDADFEALARAVVARASRNE